MDTIVQMKFSKKAIDSIEKIQILTNTDNKTRIVHSGVSLLEMVLTEISEGNTVQVVSKDGTSTKNIELSI